MSASWRPLQDNWTCSLASVGLQVPPDVAQDLPVAASVPGCVHTDLMAAGLLPDPYLDRNELEVDWVGRQTWRYSTSFDWADEGFDNVDLVFMGLDTVATVVLNGVEIASTRNMHRSYRSPVKHLLAAAANTLSVTFGSAWEFAEQARRFSGDLPNSYPSPFNFIRKMACNFGWDWGPSLVTAGIWRPVGLSTWSSARITRIRPLVTVVGDEGVARFRLDLTGADGRAPTERVTVRAHVGDHAAEVEGSVGQREVDVEVRVPDADLWWPRGLGAQPTYEAHVVVADASGEELDSWRRRIGFRNVRLVTEPDQHGTPFVIVVNDVPVPVRGANWIPDDAFPHRVNRDRYRERVQQAADANMNLLRVWGGGIYEDDAFYDVCDQMGILVWQDFLFACAAYPEEEPLRAEVEAEARENVIRLMPHPSLVLWNGNNETIWGWFDFGWRQSVGDRTWGEGYYLDLLPRIVGDTDPTRPYWPGSPYSGCMDLHPNADQHGLRHVWEVWNDVDYVKYRDCRPRFVSEFGFQGPPTWSTLRASVHDEPLTANSPGVLHHQKAEDGSGKLRRGMANHLSEPSGVDDWHYLTQLNQAQAVTFGIEHFRSLRPLCSGSVVWQLNDCWPVISWAAVDGYGRPKPLWYALRNAYATRLLTIQPRGTCMSVIAVNDGIDDWRETVTVRRITFNGRVLAEQDVRFVVAGLGIQGHELPSDLTTPQRATGELLVATTTSGTRALWFFEEDKGRAYHQPDLEIQSVTTSTGIDMTITAPTLVHGLCVFADRLNPSARVSDMGLTLLPGESRTVEVTGVDDGMAHRLETAPVLRCLNDVVRAANR